MSRTLFRILIDLMLVLSVVEGWWFVAIPIGMIGIWIFSNYFEFIIAGIVYDCLFGILLGSVMGGYWGTILSIIIMMVMNGILKIVRKV